MVVISLAISLCYLPKTGLTYTCRSLLGRITPEDISRNRTANENDCSLNHYKGRKINLQYRRLISETTGLWTGK